MRRAPASAWAPIVGGALLISGCAYYNTIYNAEHIYRRAEASRRVGQESTARDLYREVIRKTSDAYRARPESDWAPDALYLLARARLRLGELPAADGALARAQPEASGALLGSIRVYRAEILRARGDVSGALALVNEALSGPLRPEAKAEAHLLRGEWLLATGRADLGWWDLDRAAEEDHDTRVEAGLARLRWSVRGGDRERARVAADLLLGYPEGGDRLGAVQAAIEDAAQEWSAQEAAELLAGASRARWDREARGRLVLARAGLLYEAGDRDAARAEAWEVARTLGEAAAEARVVLAGWHLVDTQDIADAYAVRGILLPAGDDPEVSALVDAVDDLERYTDIGLGEPLGWFAAAEVARDRLGAAYLARGLFLAYVAGAPEEPWVPKALLAALEVSPTEGDRAWLRGRLEAHAGSPYVLAARGDASAGFEALEEELQVRLRDLRGR